MSILLLAPGALGGKWQYLKKMFRLIPVSAAAVIREERALFGMIRRKEFVGGFFSWKKQIKAQLYTFFKTDKLEYKWRIMEFLLEW